MTTAISSASSTSNLTGSSDAPKTALSEANASQDRFLKLLVAQLNNQDPMNPMDNAQMTSQMAQINTVTGIQQVNETLKSMATQFSSLQVLQGTAMVGHDVFIESNTLTQKSGVASGAIDLAGKADSLKIEILSPGGEVLDTLDRGPQEAGRHTFDWDASNYQGLGDPSFRVTAKLAGDTVASTSMARATVMSVGSEGGVMTVQLQGRTAVSYDRVKAFL